MKVFFVTNLFCIILGLKSFSQTYNILAFGAKSDSSTINTKYIQKAIDSCSISGGGTVIIPKGIFVTGTLQIKNNVNLHLEKMSVLCGSTDTSDYPGASEERSLIFIKKANNVSIDGEGIIDGRGSEIKTFNDSPEDRPYLIWANHSKNIRIENVSLKNSGYWTLWLLGSEHVNIEGISIYSHGNVDTDGIDIDSKDVIISDCIIDTDDDALCFKSYRKEPCENVVVSNCILASNCNFIKFGTRSSGGFRNISINNCTLRPTSETKRPARYYLNKYLKAGIQDSIIGLSGIAIEVVDGGFLDQVTINNINMTGIQTPIFIRLGNRKNKTGSLKNVIISNITATSGSLIASSITGVPGFYVENLIIKDIIINGMGGCTLSEIKMPVPEKESEYPENRMFMTNLPAYGFYIRHAKNIVFDNIKFNLEQPDVRNPFWIEDAQNITISNFMTNQSCKKKSIVKKVKTSDIKVHNK